MRREQRIKRHDTRLILYSLQRKWGTRADYYKVTIGTPNLDTGSKGITRIKYPLRALITTTAKFIRKFEYDIGYLAANKNFTYGGFFEPGDRLALIGPELPSGVRIEQRDYFAIDDKRYDIQRLEPLDGDVGYLLHLRHTKENKPYLIHERFVWSRITPVQEISYEL